MQNISSILRRELKFRISVKKGGEKVVDFYKSDVGAQAAWKGFSSQTLYIASRLISDEGGYEYYPEDIEDLVVKKNGAVVEAVQVKNISADITLSSLAATKTSQSGEGFFNRMCSLHKQNPSFGCIKVVHFNALGAELQEVQKGNTNTKKAITKKLVEKHGLSVEDAAWLIDSVHFEKVNLDDLELNIQTQISEYVPVKFCDWVGYANAIRSMLWLDAKRYVESNMTFISSLVAKRGKGWLCFLPLDLSGIERSDELIADGIKDLSIFNKVDLQNAIDEVKNSLTSLSINYEATDCFINNSEIYTEMLIDQINTLWNDFILVEDLVSELIENANEQNSELLNVVKLFFNCYEELETVISTQNDPSELIQIIETVSIIMFLLLPSVS